MSTYYSQYPYDAKSVAYRQAQKQDEGMATDVDVLIVDDEPPIAEFIADVLEEEGYRVRVLHDGAAALLDILRKRPRMVILDVAMPVMMGDELLRYLRRHGFGDLPIVIMTAGMNPQSYMSYGAAAVLPKPFDVQSLLTVVERYLPPEQAEQASG